MGHMWAVLVQWFPAERQSSSVLRGTFDSLMAADARGTRDPSGGNGGIADSPFRRPRSQPGGQEERGRDRLCLAGATVFPLVLGGSLRHRRRLGEAARCLPGALGSSQPAAGSLSRVLLQRDFTALGCRCPGILHRSPWSS